MLLKGGLACYNSWGRKELDTIERLNWTELKENKYNKIGMEISKEGGKGIKKLIFPDQNYW